MKNIIIGVLVVLSMFAGFAFVNANELSRYPTLIETDTLLVHETAFLGGDVRVDDSLRINGHLYVDDIEGWTGTCPSNYNLIVRDGIVLGCEGDT